MKRQRGSLSATSIGSADPARPQPAMVGRFLIEELIGRGGMSDVYRAFDPELKRYVALKVLAPALGRNPEFTERFIRESRSAAQLNHPHVVPIFEAGSDGDTLFIAMQLVRGIDLKTYIEKNGPLPLDVMVSVISQAAQALDHAHANALLHRDVKPANLMLEDREGDVHVYLTDFGLTKSLGTDSRITHTGELVGSVHYVSPEHLEGHDLSTQTDIYSLGCVLYECITGRPPFERDTDMAVLWAHLNSEVPSASKMRKQVPNVADRVIRRAMAKEPRERFSTCEAMAQSLESALAGIAHDLPVQVKPPSIPLRDRLRAASGVALALVMLSGSVFAATHDWSALPPRASAIGESSSNDGGDLARSERSGRTDQGSSFASSANRKTDGLRASSNGSGAGESGLRDAAVASLAIGKEPIGNEFRLVLSRTERITYDVRAADIGAVGEPCAADDTSAEGCSQFTLTGGERFVEIVIAEQTELDVGGFVRQDYDSDPRWDGPWIQFCNETDGAVEVHPGARVQVWLDRQGCNNDSHPTIGTIIARLFRTST